MFDESTKVLLDTDIGSDIDDAVCLAYLLANPRCDLVWNHHRYRRTRETGRAGQRNLPGCEAGYSNLPRLEKSSDR